MRRRPATNGHCHCGIAVRSRSRAQARCRRQHDRVHHLAVYSEQWPVPAAWSNSSCTCCSTSCRATPRRDSRQPALNTLLTSQPSLLSSSMSGASASPLTASPVSSDSIHELIHSIQSHDDIRHHQHEAEHEHRQQLVHHLQALHAHCSDLQSRNDSLHSDWTKLASVHKTLQHEYRAMLSTRERQQAVNERLQAEVQQLRQQAQADMEERQETEQQQEQRVQQLQATVGAQAASLQCREEEVAAFQVERESFLQQLQSVTAELSSASSALLQSQQAQAAVQATLHHVEGQHDAALAELSALQRRVAEGEDELRSARNARFVAEKELQQHADVAVMIHSLSQKVLAVKPGRAAAAGSRGRQQRKALDALDGNQRVSH